MRAGLILLFVADRRGARARTQTDVPPSGGTFDVTHYAVELDLDVDAGSIAGRERIELTVHEPDATLVFDSGALVVDSIESGGAALPFVQRARRLIVTLPAPARAGDAAARSPSRTTARRGPGSRCCRGARRRTPRSPPASGWWRWTRRATAPRWTSK